MREIAVFFALFGASLISLNFYAVTVTRVQFGAIASFQTVARPFSIWL